MLSPGRTGRVGIRTLAGASLILLLLVSVSPVGFSALSIERATGQRLLDLAFGYDVDEGIAAITQLGADGRASYRTYLLFDAAFACCYGALFSALLARLSGGARLGVIAARLPVVAASADLLEGAATAVALVRFPDTSPATIVAASAFGMVKHIGFWSSVAAIAAAWTRTRRRGTS